MRAMWCLRGCDVVVRHASLPRQEAYGCYLQRHTGTVSGAYYNEIDPYAAQWLRNLISAEHVAPGDVDERDIRLVRADDLRGYRQCHFFAGIGVWSYALRLAGWPDDEPVWTGSCPCQPFSGAGKKAGFKDQRHLWPSWSGLIAHSRPDVVLGEQVASKSGLAWLDAVLADMEAMDYACGPVVIPAAGYGAPHGRHRIFFVGHPIIEGREGRWPGLRGEPLDGASGEQVAAPGFWSTADWLMCRDGKSRPVEPGTFPLAHGAPARVGRLRAYGNAIVAPVAAEFIRAYREAR